MSGDECCNGCGKTLVESDTPGVRKICPVFFTDPSVAFHDMVLVEPLKRLVLEFSVERDEKEG